MVSFKLIKNGGILLSLVCGLSSCEMNDGFGSYRDEVPPPPPHTAKHVPGTYHGQPEQQVQAGPGKKANAAQASAYEPAQKTSPGPKRAAAPQIPVIQ